MFHFALPEFRDPDLVGQPYASRFNKFQWNTLNNCSHVGLVDYNAPTTWANTSFGRHATHVASTAAGNKYGWAKYANLYSVPMASGAWGDGIGPDDCFDVIKEFHLMKQRHVDTWGVASHWGMGPITGQGTVRPTVVNASWGQKISGYTITSHNFRGNNFIEVLDLDSGPEAPITKFGLIGTYDQYYSYFNYASPSIRAECQEMTDVGVHYIKSAGNQRQKIDVPGGVDYDNYVTLTTPDAQDGYVGGTQAFYNRGAGNISNTTIVVGSVSALPTAPAGVSKAASGQLTDGRNETASSFSEKGPRVDIYAAGEYIYGSDSLNHGEPNVLSGTSFSSPQVAGMVAIIAGKFAQTTPSQMRATIRCNSYFHQSLTLYDWTPAAQTFHSGADLALGDPVYFADTRVVWPLDRNLLGSKGSDGPADMSSPYAYAGNGYSYTGNVAFFGAYSHTYDPAHNLGLPDIGYDSHTDPTLNVDIYTSLPDGKLTPIDYEYPNYYPLTANACLSRFGTTNNYRYYKFVAYDDFARTTPSKTGSAWNIDFLDPDGRSLLHGGLKQPIYYTSDSSIPATGIVDLPYYVWDGVEGVSRTINVASDFDRSPGKGLHSDRYVFAGGAAFDGYAGLPFRPRAPSANSELFIDFVLFLYPLFWYLELLLATTQIYGIMQRY